MEKKKGKGHNYLLWGGLAAGGLLLIVGGIVVAKRMSGPTPAASAAGLGTSSVPTPQPAINRPRFTPPSAGTPGTILPGGNVPYIDSTGNYFNNGVNTQQYVLQVDTQFPVMENGVLVQVPFPAGTIFWSDAPFVYGQIAPEHKGDFSDPTDQAMQFQRYSWCSFSGITGAGGLVPMRKDLITPYGTSSVASQTSGGGCSDGSTPMPDQYGNYTCADGTMPGGVAVSTSGYGASTGGCDDGSTPDSTTGLCADGSVYLGDRGRGATMGYRRHRGYYNATGTVIGAYPGAPGTTMGTVIKVSAGIGLLLALGFGSWYAYEHFYGKKEKAKE